MSPTPRASVLAASALLLTACGGSGDATDDAGSGVTGQPTTITAGPDSSPGSRSGSGGRSGDQGPVRPRVERTVVTGLEVPWGATFLPDGTALVGERDSTRVLSVTEGGRVREVGQVPEAEPQEEAGLLGLAVSPTFEQDNLVFAYVSTAQDNRVLRMTYRDGRLGEPEPILTGIPVASYHDGGRLLFDDEGYLFVSTGDAGEEQLAQDRDSLAGKILRITPEGEPAPGNPWDGSPVWSLGHRNVQGLAFDDRGRLWATEFGSQSWDELNLIRKGTNYGWPQVEGRGEQDEFMNPYVTWRTSEASPSGLAFLDGSLWAGALRGERLWQIPVTEDGVGQPRGWFVGDYGRIRSVVATPRGSLWVTTSNRDGRGDPAPQDDRILEVVLRD